MTGRGFAGPERRHETSADSEGTKGRLQWYLNRLRSMTPLEISHRVVRLLSTHAERSGLLRREPVPRPDLALTPRSWVHANAKVDAPRYLAAAERIAAGTLDLFALRNIDLGSPPRWNRDPKTGLEAPLKFGKLLDYRDPQQVGDIKYLWELNRHAHLVTLAQAYAVSGDAKYFYVIREHLESWLAACPYGLGPNWASSLEVSLRLINWSATWQLLGGVHSPLFADAVGSRLQQRWLESVYLHAQFVQGFFSFNSSANNHLIGEAAGLFIAAQTWPHWPRVVNWRRKAKAILERETLLQNTADGVNREQAVAYQQFVLDLMLLCLLAGKANGRWFSVAYESRLEAMLEYLASIMDVGGNVPMIGDADDATAVALGQPPFSPYKSLLATGAILFHSDEFKAKAGSLDDKTRWLLGSEADALFEKESTAEATLPVRQAFPDGGYYILGCNFETPAEIRVIADAGPLGYEAIAAHGHADALAFTLSVGGLEFLIDPGTYAYHTHAEWRGYFRGTIAHNTVCVDGTDQSQSGGNFMWLHKARAGCSLWSSTAEQDVFEAWQDGYMRLADPVMHSRRITLDKIARRLIIEDTLQMEGSHDIKLLFHCSETCRIDLLADGYALRQQGGTVTIKLPDLSAASSQVFCGSTAPILGWISRRLDHKVPAPTIVWYARLSGKTVLRTEINC
ncbi:MAG: alginate lyase family protein [Prolixibacteraceae bacterium]|nr:alginate lyase family protein [Burkholderiales bacterium]